MKEASMTSPASSFTGSRSGVTSAPVCSSIATDVDRATVTDCSLAKKSPSDMCATCAFDAVGHGCGFTGSRFFFAYAFTGPAQRRSELPSRSTGLTALPSAFLYLASTSFSAGVDGFVGTSGNATPWACSSSTHATSCGIDADTFGSFTMHALGSSRHMAPRAASVSGAWPNWHRIRAARLMSARWMSTAPAQKRRRMGRRAWVARAGASSVYVYCTVGTRPSAIGDGFQTESVGSWVV